VTTVEALGLGAPRPATPRPGRAPRAAAEVRWFVPGDIDDELRPRGPSRRRTDAYHLASLGLPSSLKRRDGTGPLEWKERVGRPEGCEIAGVPGVTERWVKRRVRERDFAEPLLGRWVDVGKRLWRIGGLEICQLEIDDSSWWTVAIEKDHPSKAARKALATWRPVLRAQGEPMSYPMWLLSREQGTPDASAAAR
jgi:hypothetical protein